MICNYSANILFHLLLLLIVGAPVSAPKCPAAGLSPGAGSGVITVVGWAS